jgi:methionine-rich copper-binding protein CopC
MEKRSIGMKIFLKITAPLFLCLVLANPAHAHTSLIDSTPKRDSIIEMMPEEIVLLFGEDLLTIDNSVNNYFEVFNPVNTKVSLSEMNLEGAKLSAKVLSDQNKTGRYTIMYRVVAGDGHVVKGKLNFTIGENISNSNSAVATPIEPPLTPTQSSNSELLVDENLDSHAHANFFVHHFEHILMTVAALALIITWYLVRRKY